MPTINDYLQIKKYYLINNYSINKHEPDLDRLNSQIYWQKLSQ